MVTGQQGCLTQGIKMDYVYHRPQRMVMELSNTCWPGSTAHNLEGLLVSEKASHLLVFSGGPNKSLLLITKPAFRTISNKYTYLRRLLVTRLTMVIKLGWKRPSSLEVLGILLEANFSCQVEFNYLDYQRVYEIKTTIVKKDSTKAHISKGLALILW